MRGKSLLALCLILGWCFSLNAQDDVRNHPFYVFLQRDPSGLRELLFMDALTGDLTMVETFGERFTIFGRSVLYYEPSTARVMLATPEGETRPHPFVQLSADATRIDWSVASDGKLLAWTETRGNLAAGLTTITRVANADGSDQREIFTETRTDGIRALPVAFDYSQTALFMDYQPDGVDALTAFPQYAGLFSLSLNGGEPNFLPGEPGDFTGAGFGGELFLRLELTDDLTGFDLHVYNLETGFDRVIPALRLRGAFSQAGDILISPDQRFAVYALAQIRGFGTSDQSVRTVFVLVDLERMTQRSLAEITTFVRPVAWTEDDSAIIFTSPQRDGTWKINLQDGRLEQIAEPTYLGLLQPAGLATSDE
ncbi:MAG: hypothetical protein MUF87_03395 [Anaerolineae bacterium]|jgi:hypothetical protein|nr:hypothetical protein [Anaerolineae bacterium]